MVVDPEMAITELQIRESSLLKWLDNVQVTTNAEQKYAEDMLISTKRALKDAEEERKRLTRPLDLSKARIITLFKPHMERLLTGIELLNIVRSLIFRLSVRTMCLATSASRQW